MRRLLTLGAWPLAPQLAVAAGLAALAAALLAGDRIAEGNLGMYLLWGLWWPLVPLSFLLAGRLWCAICPVSLLGDAAGRALPRRPALAPALRGHAAALLVAAFAGAHVANLWFRFEENLPGTVALLAALGAPAAALTLAFRGRDWCVALCPLGAMGRFLARLSPTRIAGGAGACERACAARPCDGGGAGRPLCPVGIDLRSGIDPGECILCGACLKACPRLGAVGWGAGARGPAGAAGSEPLAALAFLGLALDMALTHLVDWPILFWQLSRAAGVAAGPWTETALHAAIIAGPPLAALALARPGGRRTVAALAEIALPLAGAGILAVTLRPLLVEGPLRLQRVLLGWGWEAPAISLLWRLDGAPMRALQAAVVLAGLALAVRAALRAGRRDEPGAGSAVWPAARGAAFALAWGATLLWVCSRAMSG